MESMNKVKNSLTLNMNMEPHIYHLHGKACCFTLQIAHSKETQIHSYFSKTDQSTYWGKEKKSIYISCQKTINVQKLQLGRYNNFKARTFESSICVFARKLKKNQLIETVSSSCLQNKVSSELRQNTHQSPSCVAVLGLRMWWVAAGRCRQSASQWLECPAPATSHPWKGCTQLRKGLPHWGEMALSE